MTEKNCSHSFLRNNVHEKKFYGLFERYKAPELRDQNVFCLELAELVLRGFQPDKLLDEDPWFLRGRLALVNAIVFFLYYEREPEDHDFVRAMNMLKSAKKQTEMRSLHTHLDYMYSSNNAETADHIGQREYWTFNQILDFYGRHKIINNILENFGSYVEFKELLTVARSYIK